MKNKGGKSIKTQLALYISLTIVVVCALVSAVYLNWEWAERKEDIADHVKWLSTYTATMAADSLASGNKAEVDSTIKTVMSTEERQHIADSESTMGYVEVLDSSGRPLATADVGMSASDNALMESKRAVAAESGAAGAWKEVQPNGCGMYGAYTPVVKDGVRVGTVSAGVCDLPVKAKMASTIRDSVLLLLAAGLTGALVGLRISGWFSRPISELVKGVSEVSSGNLDYRVELESYREIQILASGFNTMSGSLKEKIASIEESRREALALNEKLRASYDEARENAEKLEKLNEWSTDMAFSLEEANQFLKEEMVQTRTIVHAIKEGIVALDRNDNILLMNPAAEDLFGLRLEDARGNNVRLLVDSLVGKIEEPEAFMERFMAATSSPDADNEFSITVARPYRKVLRRRSSAIRRDDGEVIGRVVTFTDITRQKEVEDMKTNLVSTVSHELRTPLTSIKGALNLLKDLGPEDRDTRREFMAIAENNTDRLIRLITNLLDLSRMDSGMASLRLEKFDINYLVSEIAGSSAHAADKGQVVIETDLRAAPSYVLADRSKLEQVLVNLVDNALKFTPLGGKVRVCTWTADDELMLTVEDTGPGIPRDKLEKVFDKFYQLDMSATRKVGGSGLGLAICRAIVNEHGGDIRAVSPARPDGRGTRFEVRLPLSGIVPSGSRGGMPAMVERPEHETRLASRDTVLLVDDDESILKIQKMAFEKEGFRVLTAATGREALILARDNVPGFIFMDISLPDLDGITVAGILKRDPATSAIPIIFATGHIDEERVRGLEAGIGVIRKPFVEADLISAVREYYR